MKKSKILMPLAGVATLGAIAPVVTLASCSKSESTITLDGTELVLQPGESVLLKATTSSGQAITWTSSDESVATVDGGFVTAVKLGYATITAEADGKKATCEITVSTEAHPSTIDVNYLNTINSYMVYGEDYVAPHKAITALKDIGYDVLNYKLSSTHLEFAFDASEKCFIIMNGDKLEAAPKDYEMPEDKQVVFKFTNSYDKDSIYGQYLLDDYVWEEPTKQFDINASIDVGNNKNIKYMNYVGTPSNEGSTKVIRTYCEYLNIEENNDTIFHMGESNNINVYGTSEDDKCNYMELGRTAYLYAKNTNLKIAKIQGVDNAQIDVLEADTGVEQGTPFHDELVTMFIGEQIGSITPTAITEVGTLTKLGIAVADPDVKFIRMTAPITFDSTVTASIAVTNRSFVLDLGGQQLIDNATSLEAGKPLIDIQATTADSSLMFIDSHRTGCFTLKDHYINVLGNADNTNKKTATLYLEGANISYDATQKRNGAIEVGLDSNDGTLVTGLQYSRVYMFGGKIEANTESTSHDIEVSGIYVNNDAYVQVVYGAIYSSTNCIRTNGKYSGAYIDIVEGTFKTNSDAVGECIYLPQGKLNIAGGTYEGHTCIGIRGGNTTISGGYFKATGAKSNIDTASEAGSGIGGDGSVICVELCNAASATAYGTNPSITVHNATLYSVNSYIMQIFRNNDDSQKRDVNQYFEADFFGGVYYYGAEVETPVYNGIRIATAYDKDLSNYCRIYQQSGSWIYTGE